MPGPIEPDMPTSTIRPHGENIETIGSPRYDRRFRDNDSAERFPPLPVVTIPWIVEERRVRPASEQIESIGSPGGDAGGGSDYAAEGLPTGPGGSGDVGLLDCRSLDLMDKFVRLGQSDV